MDTMRALDSIGKNTAGFLIALILGGACIWVLKKQPSELGWAPAIASAVIVIALAFYYISNDEDTPEEKGDNVYYLGLLYTLLSLIFTLNELFGTGEDKSLAPENLFPLLENFGIALISTVAGILGRILVLNLVLNWREGMRDTMDPAGPINSAAFRSTTGEANPRTSRNDLYLTLHELTRAVNALARFHHIVRQYASDTQTLMDDHGENLRKDSLSFRKSLEDNCQTYTSALKQNTEKFTHELKNQAQLTLNAVGDSFDSITIGSKSHITSIQLAQESHLKELRQMNHMFHDDLQTASKAGIKAIEQNLESAAGQVGNLINSSVRSHEQIGISLSSMESSLQQNLVTLDSLCQQTGKAVESVAALETEIKKAVSSFTTLRTASEFMTSAVENLVKLEATAAKRTSGDTKLYDQTADSIRAMDQEIKNATESLDSLASVAKTRLEDLDKSRKWFGFGRK